MILRPISGLALLLVMLAGCGRAPAPGQRAGTTVTVGDTAAPAVTSTDAPSTSTTASVPYSSATLATETRPEPDRSFEGIYAVQQVPADLPVPTGGWGTVRLVNSSYTFSTLEADCGSVGGYANWQPDTLDFEVYTPPPPPTDPVTDHLGQTIDLSYTIESTIVEQCGADLGAAMEGLVEFLATDPAVARTGDQLLLTSADGHAVELTEVHADGADGLLGRRWQLAGYRYPGQQAVPVDAAHGGWLEFGDTAVVGTTCNGMSGPVVIEPTHIRSYGIGFTEKYCQDQAAAEQAVHALFDGSLGSDLWIDYTVADGSLTLTSTAVILVYTDVGPATTTS